MRQKLTLDIPHKTKAMVISIVSEDKKGELELTTRAFDTDHILKGKPIKI